MEQEKQMTQSESLELISAMINRVKNRFSENGFQYLLWGWAVLICCLIQFVAIKIFKNENGYRIWLALWLVVFYQVYYVRKNKKKRTVRTYTDGLIGFIWLSFFIVVILTLFICVESDTPLIIDRILLALYGMPIFLMGGLIKFRPLIIGATCCWILAAISPFVEKDFNILLVAIAIIAAWIIPGYMLSRRYKKMQNNELEKE
jgi:MFS family permease